MSRFRIALATRVFDRPLREALQMARDAGVDGVQFDARHELRPAEFSETGRRQFLHLLEELGLAVASLAFPLRKPLCSLDGLEARVEALKSAMQFAYQLKAPVVTARIGPLPAEDHTAERELLRDVLSELARHANRVGATLAVTPVGEPPEKLAALLETVTEGPLGVNFDPAVYVLAGRNPSEAFRALHPFVLHAQVRDAVREADGTGLEVPVGRGEVDWDEFLALLEEAAFRHWLTVDRTTGDDKAGDAARAVEFLRRMTLS